MTVRLKLKPWVALPTQWVQDQGLKAFRWRDRGADQAAALMVLVIMAHYAEGQTGEGALTYTDMCDRTDLSRAKIAAGIKILEERGLITRRPDVRSHYKLSNYDVTRPGWGKLPALRLYEHGRVSFFAQLNLRRPAELDALKLYLLIVARRTNATNLASISYDKIEDYAGIDRNRIKSGLSLLAANGMVHVEHLHSEMNEYGIANHYRLPHIDPGKHMGTYGRQQLVAEA